MFYCLRCLWLFCKDNSYGYGIHLMKVSDQFVASLINLVMMVCRSPSVFASTYMWHKKFYSVKSIQENLLHPQTDGFQQNTQKRLCNPYFAPSINLVSAQWDQQRDPNESKNETAERREKGNEGGEKTRLKR